MSLRRITVQCTIAAMLVCLSGTPRSSRSASEWITTLEGQERIKEQKIDEVLKRLNLKPGTVVADIGTGSGLFAQPIAKAVTPGKVYAVDIQQDLLDYVNKRDKEENITNVQTVLGGFNDPKLPVRNADLAFINDVLHHIENRAAYLKALGGYIKPSHGGSPSSKWTRLIRIRLTGTYRNCW